MKTRIDRMAGLVASLAVLVVGLSVPSALFAQSTLTGVNIPFNFYVGELKFASGEYTVKVTGDYIKLSDGNGHSAFVLTTRVTKNNWRDTRNGLLVFNHYENAYFLSEVWREGYSNGNQLMKTSTEVQAARNNAASAPIALSAHR